MKLDFDCIRDVLLVLEKTTELQDNFMYSALMLGDVSSQLPKYSQKEVLYTLQKLEEAEYILVANYNEPKNDFNVNKYFIYDITFKGHEYLNSVRSPEIWGKIKKIAGLTLSVIPTITEKYLISKIDL